MVRFDFEHRGQRIRPWLLLQRGEGEICNFDLGFGDDVVVAVRDPVMFARWHLGLVEWPAAVACGAIEVSGPPTLCRMLPTWNSTPEFFAARRRDAQAPTPQAPIPT